MLYIYIYRIWQTKEGFFRSIFCTELRPRLHSIKSVFRNNPFSCKPCLCQSNQVSFIIWCHRLPRTTWGQIGNKKRQKSINHFLITWIIFFSPKYYLAKLLTTWVMVFERFSSMSLWSTTGPTVSERRDGDVHTAHCFLYECMLHLVSAWLRDQNKTTLWLKNQPAGSHVLPRTKVSKFCWKIHTDVSMLRGE